MRLTDVQIEAILDELPVIPHNVVRTIHGIAIALKANNLDHFTLRLQDGSEVIYINLERASRSNVKRQITRALRRFEVEEALC